MASPPSFLPIPGLAQAGNFTYTTPRPEGLLAQGPEVAIEAGLYVPTPTEELNSTYKAAEERVFWQSDSVASAFIPEDATEEVPAPRERRMVSASNSFGQPESLRPGSQLLSFLASGQSSYQSVSGRYGSVEDGTRAPLTEVNNVRMLYGHSEEKSTLTFTTRSGRELTMSLTHQVGFGRTEDERIISVDRWLTEFSVDEPLSEAEALEVVKLASALDEISNRYIGTGKFSLQRLDLGSLTEITDIRFELQGMGDSKGSDLLQVNYSNHADERQLEVLLHKDKLQQTLSKDGWATLGTEERREQSRQQFLALIQDTADRGDATQQQLALMREAFSLLHEADPGDREAGQKTTASGTTVVNETGTPEITGDDHKAPEFAADSAKLLSGLQDFTFSFIAETETPNSDPLRADEKVSFNVEFAQQTEGNKEEAGSFNLRQTLAYEMSASYYEPLPKLERVDFDKQNYQYIETQASATQVTDIGYKDFEIAHASMIHQNEWEESRRVYHLGELAQHIRDGDQQMAVTDLTDSLKVQQEQVQHLHSQRMIDELLEHQFLAPWQRG